MVCAIMTTAHSYHTPGNGGGGDENNTGFYLFRCTVTLTDLGLENIPEVSMVWYYVRNIYNLFKRCIEDTEFFILV